MAWWRARWAACRHRAEHQVRARPVGIGLSQNGQVGITFASRQGSSGTASHLLSGLVGRLLLGGLGSAVWVEFGGGLEQGAAQVVQEPEPCGGHGEAALACPGAVQHGPDQASDRVLAGEPADDRNPAAGLSEGPLDEVGVPDPGPVFTGHLQVDREALAVGE